MGRNQARRRGEVNHGRASATAERSLWEIPRGDSGRISPYVTRWGTSSFGVVHSSTILWTAGRIFEDYVGRMCGTQD